ADAVDDLASSSNTPWANLAAAEAAARHEEIVLPLADQVHTNRLNLAAAENAYRAQLGEAGRTRWLAGTAVDAQRARISAAQVLGSASAALNPGGLTSPAALTPPT